MSNLLFTCIHRGTECPTPINCMHSDNCTFHQENMKKQLGSGACNLASEWDNRGLQLAECVALWSKDPSTKVGAAIFRPDKTVASIGFNGFPRGVADDQRLDDRTVKYEIVVHAELNAIFNCRERPVGHTLYSTLFPCTKCAAAIIQSGIKRVCSPVPDNPRWIDSNRMACNLLKEAGVEVCLITPEQVILNDIPTTDSTTS